MRNHLAALTIFVVFVTGGMSVKPVAAAEGSDQSSALEQRIQNLEKQLGELKGLLEEQKKAQAEKAAPPAPAAPGAPAAPPAGPKLSGAPGKIEVGGDIRWRGRNFDNLFDFNSSKNDHSQTFRFRPRVYVDWKPTDDFEAYVRFTKEWVYGQDNEVMGYDVHPGKDIIFDNAWAEYKNILDSGLSIRIGRQDLMYGEGFVLFDGTPQDGSETTSFDAAKVSYAYDWGTTDLLYAKLFEYNAYNSDDEDMYGIYNKWKFGDTGVEPYLLVREKRNNAFAGASAKPYFDPLTQSWVTNKVTWDFVDPSPAEETYLLGLRTTHSFDLTDGVKLALAAEGGKEWGRVDFTGASAWENAYPGYAFNHFGKGTPQGKVDRDAWGGTFNGTVSFDKVTWKPSIKAAVTVLSGDDPKTKNYEGWDDFYSEWPKFSELYVYTLYDGAKGRTGGNDPDIGVWTNMYIPEVMLSVKPTTKLTESLRYLYFGAMEKNGPGTGNERGHNLQWLQEYVFTKNLSGHVLVEWFNPGNYYKSPANPNPSDAWFARFQLMYKF